MEVQHKSNEAFQPPGETAAADLQVMLPTASNPLSRMLARALRRMKNPAGLITHGILVLLSVSFAPAREKVVTSKSVERADAAGKSEQRYLPFEQAQGTHDERRSHLGLALMQVDCDLVMRELVMMVFNMTHGGVPGEILFRTHSELAQQPWGLCCSVSKVRQTVNTAVHAGLILAAERRYKTGSVAGLEYSINWAGINILLGFSSCRRREAAGVSTEQTPVFLRQGSVTGRHHTKETTTLKPPLMAGQGLVEASEVSTADGARANGWDASARAFVETELASMGYQRGKRLASEAEAAGVTIDQFVAICDEYRANRKLFDGPGAIAHRLREGCWPVAGVLPPNERHACAAKQHREKLTFELDAVVRDARKRRLSDGEITPIVRGMFPHDLCDELDWREVQP